MDPVMVTALEQKYGKRRSAEWSQEREELCAAIDEIEDTLGARYQLSGPIGVGGAGVTVLVRDLSLSVGPDFHNWGRF